MNGMTIANCPACTGRGYNVVDLWVPKKVTCVRCEGTGRVLMTLQEFYKK